MCLFQNTECHTSNFQNSNGACQQQAWGSSFVSWNRSQYGAQCHNSGVRMEEMNQTTEQVETRSMEYAIWRSHGKTAIIHMAVTEHSSSSTGLARSWNTAAGVSTTVPTVNACKDSSAQDSSDTELRTYAVTISSPTQTVEWRLSTSHLLRWFLLYSRL